MSEPVIRHNDFLSQKDALDWSLFYAGDVQELISIYRSRDGFYRLRYVPKPHAA